MTFYDFYNELPQGYIVQFGLTVAHMEQHLSLQ